MPHVPLVTHLSIMGQSRYGASGTSGTYSAILKCGTSGTYIAKDINYYIFSAIIVAQVAHIALKI